MERLEELKRAAKRTAEKISTIECANRREENAGKVGKFFKTRNSYSCPERPSDYWWLYAHVTHMDKYGYLYAETFEVDRDGRVRTEPGRNIFYAHDWTPIGFGEYRRGLTKLDAAIKKLTRVRYARTDAIKGGEK